MLDGDVGRGGRTASAWLITWLISDQTFCPFLRFNFSSPSFHRENIPIFAITDSRKKFFRGVFTRQFFSPIGKGCAHKAFSSRVLRKRSTFPGTSFLNGNWGGVHVVFSMRGWEKTAEKKMKNVFFYRRLKQMNWCSICDCWQNSSVAIVPFPFKSMRGPPSQDAARRPEMAILLLSFMTDRQNGHSKSIFWALSTKQVPQGYIRCDYFIVTHCTIALFMMSFKEFKPSKPTVFVLRK